MQKDPSHLIETSETHGYKPFYTESDIHFTERSCDEENIDNYKLMDEFSNKNKECAEDSEERKKLCIPKEYHSVYIDKYDGNLRKNQWSTEIWYEYWKIWKW